MRLSLLLALILPTAAQTPAPPPVAPPQSITVTADRGLTDLNDAATSTALLNQQQLQQAPGLTLDDSLHQIAGFQLFRRTSSWTANPTSAGLSLRGLGSTAASRTLVVSDQVPLNDPFGAWVHWNEIPTLAIQQVQLLRGGASDLYGSSAIGGVVDILPTTPAHPFTFAADTAGATENTGLCDALLNSNIALAALSVLSTGGYVPTAPQFRGTIDTVSNVTSEAARVELRIPSIHRNYDAFLRGNLLNEARDNGTPDQTNGTRLWRYIAGGNLNTTLADITLRLYGSREAYRQSFSSIAANRNSETLTKLQHVPTDELGFVLQAAHAFPHALTIALGFDLRDIRATDNETSLATTIITSTSARQRATGGYADAIWQPTHWSLSGSIRVDSFRTFTAQQVLSTSPIITPLPNLTELFAAPRFGLVRYLPHGLALTGTAFRAFRGPTMNELYRTGQVGSQTTLANNALLAERATGFEFGPELTSRIGHLRATYFWTEVNRPITTVLLSQTAATQTLQRENLGQIRSDGLMLEAQSNRFHSLDATFSYQLAIATVTAYSPTLANSGSVPPSALALVGKWTPEVPRQSLTSTLNYTHLRVANVHLIASYTGQMYDDSANTLLLHPYARFDLSADRTLTHRLTLFADSQNLLNRTIQAGLTPTLTLAAPRLVEAGLRFLFTH